MARIAFLQNFWFEFLGPMYIASLLRQDGHEVKLFIGRDERDLVAKCEDFKPNIAAFSVSSGSQSFAYRVGKAFQKAFGAVTIMGGPHATFYPDAVKPDGMDIACRGEGEYAMRDLAAAVDGGNDYRDIKNLWVKKDGEIYKNELRDLVADLNVLPSPDRALYYDRYQFLRESPNKHFVTARGCPYDCTFCSNKGFNDMYEGKGEIMRRPSIDRIIGEIVEVRDRYGIQTVRFDDDVFTIEKRWVKKFLPRYAAEVKLPFTCLVRADHTDEDTARLLGESGCHMVYFGVESGDEKLREDVLKKGVTDDQIVNAARLLHKHKVKIGTFNMLGIPGETLETAYKTVALNQRIRTDYPWCSVMQPYPDTEVEHYAKAQGYLDQDTCPDDFGSSYFNRSIIAHNKDGSALENLHKFFFLAVKMPTLWPVIRHLIKLPPNALFNTVFRLTYGYRYVKTYQISVPRLVHTAWLLRGQF